MNIICTDIYDDLISRRVHSSDAEKFAEICPCPCNGVGWGFIWWDTDTLIFGRAWTVKYDETAYDVQWWCKDFMIISVLLLIFCCGHYLQGNDIILISCWINVPWTCHLILRYSLLLKGFFLELKIELIFNCVHLLSTFLFLMEICNWVSFFLSFRI